MSLPTNVVSSSSCSPSSAPTSDTDSALALALSLSGLLVCCFFLSSTWKRWVRSHRRSRTSASSPALASNSDLITRNHQLKHDNKAISGARAAVNGSPSTLRLTLGVPSRSHSSQFIHDVSQLHNMESDERQALRVWAAIVDGARFWTRRLLHPQGLNQLLSNLLLCSWTIMTYDQICHVLFLTTITFRCPQFNCHTYTSFATPGCAAAVFEGLQLIVQPFGVCFFAVASVNRFVNVYSRLSRNRYIALHVGTALVFLVCTGLSVVTIFVYTVTSPLPPLPTIEALNRVAQAQELLLLADFVTYLVLGSVCTLALIMGLHYIFKIRKEVSALRPTIATPSLFQASADAIVAAEARAALSSSHGLVVVSTAARPSSPSSPTLLTVPANSLSSSALHTTVVAPPEDAPSSPPSVPRFSFARRHKRKINQEKSVTTILCIAVNIGIMVVFPIMHPYVNKPRDGGGAKSTSALFDSAFMLMCQKLFAGMVTTAINQMTVLVLSTRSSAL